MCVYAPEGLFVLEDLEGLSLGGLPTFPEKVRYALPLILFDACKPELVFHLVQK